MKGLRSLFVLFIMAVASIMVSTVVVAADQSQVQGELGLNWLNHSMTMKDFFNPQKKQRVLGYECRVEKNIYGVEQLSLIYTGRPILTERSDGNGEVNQYRKRNACKNSVSLANYKHARLDISFPGFDDIAITIQNRRKKYVQVYFDSMKCHISETERMTISFQLGTRSFIYHHDLGEGEKDLQVRLDEFEKQCNRQSRKFNASVGRKSLWIYFPGFGSRGSKSTHFVVKTELGFFSSYDQEIIESAVGE